MEELDIRYRSHLPEADKAYQREKENDEEGNDGNAPGFPPFMTD